MYSDEEYEYLIFFVCLLAESECMLCDRFMERALLARCLNMKVKM